MEYGLVFTIYGIIFMVLLLVTVRIKKIKDSVKSSLYLLLIKTCRVLSVEPSSTKIISVSAQSQARMDWTQLFRYFAVL